jgi:hypothetical protein
VIVRCCTMILGTFVWIVGLVWLRVWLDSHSFDSMTVFIHHGSISIRVNVQVCIVIGIVCVVTVVVKGSFETAAVAATATVAVTVATARKGVVGVSVPKVILCGCEWVGIVGVGL